MLHTVLRRKALGESVEQIRPALIIPTGKRKRQSPTVASIYRTLAEHMPCPDHWPFGHRPIPAADQAFAHGLHLRWIRDARQVVAEVGQEPDALEAGRG
ncbi:hypothetical protein [Streptomyces sp.]|uniref:hypothetical protein n=1 Tax=Streptomyces sp. TaxID=1931 RepID=UPI0025D4E8BA|nr:hypothetical protein [Streptomyces sp.]